MLFYLLGMDTAIPAVDQNFVTLVTDADGVDMFMQFTDNLEEASQFEFTAGCDVITADYMTPNSDLPDPLIGLSTSPLRFDYSDTILTEGYFEDICRVGSDGSFTCQGVGESTLYVCLDGNYQVHIGEAVPSGCTAVTLRAFLIDTTVAP